jgi:chromosome segregation ATPase
VFDPAPRETLGRLALLELESVIRNVTDQLAVFRRRALAAEAQLREQEGTLHALREAVDRARRAAEDAAELRQSLSAVEREAARVAGLEAALHEAREAASRVQELEAALAEIAAARSHEADVVDGRTAAELAVENATLRDRLGEALERTRVIGDRVRFLRQQLDLGGVR